MKPSEYLRYDATALADLIRRGEVTSREVTEAAIDRASAVNPRLNAVCHPQFAEAMDQDFPAEGPFAGVPLLLKDLAHQVHLQHCELVESYTALARRIEDSISGLLWFLLYGWETS